MGGSFGPSMTTSAVVGCAGTSTTATPRKVPLVAAAAIALDTPATTVSATAVLVVVMYAVTVIELAAMTSVTSSMVMLPPAAATRLAL